MPIRLLVLDIDDCTYSSISDRPDKLSQPIIDRALDASLEYKGIFACTHRSYLCLEYCKTEALRVAANHYENGISKNEFHRILDNFPTYKVIPTFAEITHLPVLAISTHDDILYDTCGAAYDGFIKAFEELDRPASAGQRHLSHEEIYANWHTKNPQLTQIAIAAKKQFPGEEIILDYFDDKISLCEHATQVTSEAGWPEGVSLNAFNYDYINKQIIPVKPDSSLKKNSLFNKRVEVNERVEAKADTPSPQLAL